MKLSKGFTLIELIVVMAVFLFVIGAAISIFISIIQSQKKVLSEQQLLNQVSYVEEYISKALRMAGTEDSSGSCLGADNEGYIYLLTPYDTTSGLYRGIKFINQSNGVCQHFFLSGDGTDVDPYILKELKNSVDDDDAIALTSANLQINSIVFSINGSSGSTFVSDSCTTSSQCGASSKDTIQPRATILFNINIPGESSKIIQTTVSQRNLNVNNGQR